jgi:hypothetical protein
VQQGNGVGRKIQMKGDLTAEQIKAAKTFNQTVLKTELSIKTVQYVIGDSKISGKISDLTPVEIAGYQRKNKVTINGKLDGETLPLIFSALTGAVPPQYENAKDLVIDYYSINISEAILVKYDSSLTEAVNTSFALGKLRKISLGKTAFNDVSTLKTTIETGLTSKNTAVVSATTTFTPTGKPSELSQKDKNIAIKVNQLLLREPGSIKIVAELVSAASKSFDDAFITEIVKYQWSKKQEGDQEVKDKKRTENPTIKETGIIDEDTFLELLNDLLKKDEFDLVLMLIYDYYRLNLKSLVYDASDTGATGYKTATDSVTKKGTVTIGKSFFTEKDPKKILKKLEAIKSIGTLTSSAGVFKEWEEHPRIQNYFADAEEGYIALRPKFDKLFNKSDANKKKVGGKNPMQYLDDNIVTFKFLDQNLTLHKNYKTVLERVETDLKTKDPTGYTDVVNSYKGHVQGFWVRTIADSDSLSQHSLGMAIDIDPATNPHVKGEDIYTVITYVTGLEIYKKQPSAKELQDASLKFKSDFNATYITDLERKKTSLGKFVDLSAKLSPQATLIKDLNSAISIYDLTAAGKAVTKERMDLITKISGFKTTLDSMSTEFNAIKTDVDANAQSNFQSRLDNAKNQQQNLSKIGNGIGDRKVEYDSVIEDQKAFTVLYSSYSGISITLNANLAKMTEIVTLINKPNKKGPTNKSLLLAYAQSGFFDLSLTLVNALTAASEIRWGGNYEKNKDFMHFELNPLDDFL